jgi:hypothetical protein
MKNITILSVIAVLFATSNVFGQQGFTNAVAAEAHNRHMLSFTVPAEANVAYYRIEASEDNKTFGTIGTVASTGNSVMAKTYQYTLSGHSSKYYRIGKVGVDRNIQYSKVLAPVQAAQNAEDALGLTKEVLATKR